MYRQLKIAQLNCNRRWDTHDLLEVAVQQQGLDIVLGQEPNLRRVERLVTDRRKNAFVQVFNSTIRPISWTLGEGYVGLELRNFTIWSVYFSPNEPNEEFERLLDEVEGNIRASMKKALICGDFNARTVIAGDSVVNARGIILEEWLVKNRLLLANTPGEITFRGPRGQSVIDLTLISETSEMSVENWRVQEQLETLSDHELVSFEIHAGQEIVQEEQEAKGWRYSAAQLERLEKRFARVEVQPNPQDLMKKISDLCDSCLTRRKKDGHRKPKYWWTREIAEVRKECEMKRRILRRKNRSRAPIEQIEEAKNNYKQKRKELTKMIKKTKEEKWKTLCKELENNVWGTAYQVLTKRLGTRKINKLDEETIRYQYRKLFPVDNSEEIEIHPESVETEPFTNEELLECVTQLKMRKAPGSDGVTNEILRACVKAQPKAFLEVYNQCLRSGYFPDNWKEARLVLVEKPLKMDREQSYRPICLLSTVAKLFERLINKRLLEEIEGTGVLSEKQHAYRKGRGTVDAVMSVMRPTWERRRISLTNRGYGVMALIDIKNAFNSVSWNQVRIEVKKAGVSNGLQRLISSYLSKRRILLPNGELRNVNCGLPQGSVIGGTLWNIVYNQVVDLKHEEGVQTIGYADDLAIVIRSARREELIDKMEYAVSKVADCLKRIGLQMEESKTELVILEGRRTLKELSVRVGDTMIDSSRSVRYLGVHIEKDARMTTHVQKTSERAAKMQNLLARMMPRIGGPPHAKRKIICSVVQSVVLYAAPAWEGALKFKKYRSMIRAVERKCAISITAAYRTVSTEAVGALAGFPPFDLLAWERARNWEERGERRSENRREMLERWQTRWRGYRGWASVFIKDVTRWMKRGIQMDFYTTQAMTGHGSFGKYLKEIRKRDSDECWYGCGTIDSPEHTIFQCARFEAIRVNLESEIGRQVTRDSIAEILVGDDIASERVMTHLRSIMEIKVRKEKELERDIPRPAND